MRRLIAPRRTPGTQGVDALWVAGVASCVLFMASPRGAAPQQVPTFRSGIDLVNLGVTVTDRKGALLTDLTADDFEVIEDGKKQTVTYFATGGAGDDAAPNCTWASCSTSARAWARTSASRGRPPSSS